MRQLPACRSVPEQSRVADLYRNTDLLPAQIQRYNHCGSLRAHTSIFSNPPPLTLRPVGSSPPCPAGRHHFLAVATRAGLGEVTWGPRTPVPWQMGHAMRPVALHRVHLG